MLKNNTQDSDQQLAFATTEHLPALLELQSREGFNHWSETQITRLIDTQSVFIKLDEGSNELIGFIFYRLILDEAELLNIVVAPCYRHQGWGEVLVLALLKNMAQRNARQLLLEVASTNIAAITLYKKLLFKQIDTRRNYYPQTSGGPVDAYIMVLMLPSVNVEAML